MNTKKIISILLLFLGEALIIAGFLLFGKALGHKILLLNIVVSSVIFSLYFGNTIFPWNNLNDKTQKSIGSIGIKMVFTLLYTFLAIATMIFFNVVHLGHIQLQFLVQGLLFFLLLLGLYFGISSSDKVLEVYIDEKKNRDTIDDMKKATKEVQLKLGAMANVPIEVSNRINGLLENLRFISPSNSSASLELEQNYTDEMKKIIDYLFDMSPNFDKIVEIISNCERIYKDRKQVYSN